MAASVLTQPSSCSPRTATPVGLQGLDKSMAPSPAPRISRWSRDADSVKPSSACREMGMGTKARKMASSSS